MLENPVYLKLLKEGDEEMRYLVKVRVVVQDYDGGTFPGPDREEYLNFTSDEEAKAIILRRYGEKVQLFKEIPLSKNVLVRTTSREESKGGDNEVPS